MAGQAGPVSPVVDARLDIGTLGMFILDKFQFFDGDKDLGDKGLGEQIGGGGTYFVVAASIWLDPSHILMVVDRGDDLSAEVQGKLDEYAKPLPDTKAGKQSHRLWRYRARPDATTRALNIYRGEERGFEYLSKRIRLDPVDLLQESGSHRFFPRIVHFVCSPARAVEIARQIDAAEDRWLHGCRPILVWEPIPDSARPENFTQTLEICSKIDVLSPNHEESAAFLSRNFGKDSRSRTRDVEEMAITWLQRIPSSSGTQHTPIVCIRAGAQGSLIARSSREHLDREGFAPELTWVSAYHDASLQDKIVDVTGAGNAWLGGFAAGLALQIAPRDQGQGLQSVGSDVLERAARMGSVSAGLTIEQLGLPTRAVSSGGLVTWNGDAPESRLPRMTTSRAS